MSYKTAFRNKTKTLIAASCVAAFAALVFVVHPARTYAAVSQTQAAPQVSFTFDDGLSSALSKAAPALSQYGFTGTDYVISGCVGTVGTCAADQAASYMTWDQITQLKNLGWEIGGHSATHPEMTTVTAAKLETEVAQSKSVLEAHGFTPKAFATPYGDYNGNVEAAIAKYYTSHRGFHDAGYNTWPYTPYLLKVQQVQGGVSVATVKGYIDAAKANNQWLILVFHDIKDVASANPEDYEYSTADLATIAAYVKQQNIKVTNITDGLVTGTDNKLPGGNFDSGLSNGWTTDAPASVVQNTAGNGSAPGNANSVAMTASTTANVHLFSPTVTVDPAKKYWISTYANIKQRTSGEVAVYVDEYDGNGVWVSGKYLASLTSDQIKDFSLIYQTSTSVVKSIRIQYIVTANSGILVYIDNAQVFVVETAGSAPDPTPTLVNLMPNSQFDNGLADGWTTDNSVAFQADAANHGSPSGATKSIKLTAGATQAHLFAPKVAVEAGKTYTIRAYVNLATITTGELGYYIDEYDSAGNWISGKYIPGKRNAGASEITFDYTPTSANVSKAALQFILVANSGITGYLDDVRWMATTTTTTPPPADTTAPVVTNVTVSNTTADSATISWTTDEPTTGVVNYGTSASYGQAANATTLGTSHTVTLTGLTASTNYQFQIVAKDAANNTSSNTTGAFGTLAAPTPPATPTNLLTNGSFQNGVADGWTTDSAADVTADATSKGDASEEVVHSVKLVANPTKNVHLFSPKVTVDPLKTYNLSAHLDITARTSGEVAFYIDEYDVNGNWVSGKYITSKTTLGGATASFNYTPTSTNVASASLQVIVTSGSGITAYLDNVRWTAAA